MMGGALTCLVGSQQPLLFNRLAHQLVLCGVQLEHVACAALWLSAVDSRFLAVPTRNEVRRARFYQLGFTRGYLYF